MLESPIMKILFVTPYLATPAKCGAQRRLEGLIKGLSSRHEITLLSYRTRKDEDPRSTHDYCRRVVTVTRDVLTPGAAYKRALQFASLASTRSFEHALYHDPDLQRQLYSLIANDTFDVVQVEFSQMGIFSLPRLGMRAPRFVLDEHNIEYEIVKRTADSDGGAIRRLYSRINWQKVKAEELDAWRRFDGVALTSKRDEELLLEDAPGTRTVVVPNAADLETFRRNDATAPTPGTLLFFGALDYHPNTEGIEYFLDEIWPTIRRERPATKLTVVGRNPPASLLARQTDDVNFTGFVDDPRPYIDSAAVVVVPLRIGGGTRFKIVEAMAMGKAIVSTTLGAEGLDAVHEQHVLLADEAADFARQVVRVLDAPELAEQLGHAARELAVQRYGWSGAVKTLEQFYQTLL